MVRLLPGQGVVQWQRQKFLLIFFALLFLWSATGWEKAAYAATNQVPVANAGAAQTVNENTKVTLDGSASKDSDGTIAQYAWKQTAGPTVTLTGATTAKPTFTAPTLTADTALTFELTVTDNSKATAKSSVIITVKNINVAPVANAGAAQSVNENTKVTLDGSASKDSDGTIAQYVWKQTAGPTVTLTGATTAKPTFTAPIITADTALTFELTVTDNSKATAKSSVIITVKNINVAPVANAGAAQTVNGNTKVTLDGSASKDSDGTIAQYAWKQTAGPTVTLTGATTAKPTFTAPIITADTALTFELTVTDNSKATAKSSVIITVKNINVAPVANAGAAQTVNENTKVTLDGSASKDSDGTIAQYAWKQTAGPTVTLTGATTAKPTFTAPTLTADTALTFELTVTDNSKATAKSSVIITVKNINVAPVANAGAAQTVNENTKVTLDGSASKDSDGTIAQYAWKQTAGPTVTLTGATTAKPTFTAPIITADTALTFELTVTDNSKATAKSSVIITVKNINVAPVANAGVAQSVNENTKVTLDGSASKDSDGTIAQYAWKQTAGPTVTLTGATTAKPTFTAPNVAADTSLTFELTVTDNNGATAKSSVIITVKNVNVPLITGKLNDTGITSCSDSMHRRLLCPQLNYPNQDADNGRDITANDNSDGHAGFSFTKLDANGAPLPDQSLSYMTKPWACVKDNVTGLIWEVKTDDGGLHDKDWMYSWYEPDNTKNGGFAGYQNPNNDSVNCFGYIAGDTNTYCNTKAYVDRVNTAGWCGGKNWRIPTLDELVSLARFDRYQYPAIDAQAIDTNIFPNSVSNTRKSAYWSSTSSASCNNCAWFFTFDYSYDYSVVKILGLQLQLVRSGQ